MYFICYDFLDPDAQLLAQNLIIQAAMEKATLIPEEPDSNELSGMMVVM